MFLHGQSVTHSLTRSLSHVLIPVYYYHYPHYQRSSTTKEARKEKGKKKKYPHEPIPARRDVFHDTRCTHLTRLVGIVDIYIYSLAVHLSIRLFYLSPSPSSCLHILSTQPNHPFMLGTHLTQPSYFAPVSLSLTLSLSLSR